MYQEEKDDFFIFELDFEMNEMRRKFRIQIYILSDSDDVSFLQCISRDLYVCICMYVILILYFFSISFQVDHIFAHLIFSSSICEAFKAQAYTYRLNYPTLHNIFKSLGGLNWITGIPCWYDYWRDDYWRYVRRQRIVVCLQFSTNSKPPFLIFFYKI